MTDSGSVQLSRRELVLQTVGGSVANDRSVLVSLIGIEQVVVFAYEHIIASGKLTSAGAQQFANEALGQEHAHASRLIALVRALGGEPPPPPSTVLAAQRQLEQRHFSGTLEHLSDEGYCLRRLYDIEAIAIGGYYQAFPKLTSPGLLQIAAEIMGSEAQHAAAIGGLLHPGNIKRIVPLGFVAGKH